MEVKPKSRVTIIPAGSTPSAPAPSGNGPSPITPAAPGSSTPPSTGMTVTGSGSSAKITIGGGGARPSIGGGGGGGFQPRPAFSRGPRRDLTKFNTDEHRINERIRVPQVRLIDQDGEQKGVVSTTDALQMAKDIGLDLVAIFITTRLAVGIRSIALLIQLLLQESLGLNVQLAIRRKAIRLIQTTRDQLN